MARFHPARPPRSIEDSERKTWLGLRRLGDDWHVLHSVAWQSLRSGRPGDGEADFVLISRTAGIIVLEVKGGGVSVADGRWVSVDRNGDVHEIKNPFEQALTSKYALVRMLPELGQTMAGVPVSHGVVFPDVSLSDGIGLYGPREIILDREDLRDVTSAIERLTRHWNQRATLTGKGLRQLVSRLSPTVEVRRRLVDDVGEAGEELLRLTENQCDVLRGLRLNRRALIVGGAGTGKTVLSVHKSCQLAEEGLRVLLTCYNDPLAAFLSTQVGDRSVEVSSFHSLTMRRLRKAGVPVPREPPSAWWDQEAADCLCEVAEVQGPAFDALVVDEGQDFAAGWMTALCLLLTEPDDAPVYVFADVHQQIYRSPEVTELEYPRYQLSTNCRNTHPIAERVCGVFGGTLDCRGVDGPEPVFLKAGSNSELLSLVQRAVSRMLCQEGLHPDQIVVLSDSRTCVRKLRSMVVADHCIVEPGQTGVACETVHRFKGLEADVVVLALSQGLAGCLDRLRYLGYVGMSRARSMLVVIGDSGVKGALGWC